jgi:hypothetical protein
VSAGWAAIWQPDEAPSSGQRHLSRMAIRDRRWRSSHGRRRHARVSLGHPEMRAGDVDNAITEAAAQLSSMRGVEEVSRYGTTELASVVQSERTQARLAGSETLIPCGLRATLIFRREETPGSSPTVTPTRSRS